MRSCTPRSSSSVLKDAVVVPLVDTLTYNAKRVEVQGEHLDALASYVWLYDVQNQKVDTRDLCCDG